MVRRSFLQALGVVGATASAVPTRSEKTRYYTLESLFLKNGDQGGRLNDFMTGGFLPAARRAHPGPMMFLEAIVAAHMPQFVMVMGFGSGAEALSLYTRLHQQEGYSQAVAAWESGSNEPYESTSLSLLEAADYSPEIRAGEPGKAPRVFELRTYHAPTWRQWGALNERFAGPEIRIFHRCGIHPMLYASTVFGTDLPNLIYLIPFDDLAAREKAWSAFAVDPEWIKVRSESVARHGEIVTIAQSALFKAASYSPIR
jgi:hypothetical protein